MLKSLFHSNILVFFLRFLELPLINCEIELDLSQTKDCVLSEHSSITGVTFQINNAKLYVSVFSLSINDNIKFLENIKQRFNRTISWNKYRSEITTHKKKNNSNLDYLINPTFRNINRLFVLPFKNGSHYANRNSFKKYYMSLVEIKDFNALVDNEPFFDESLKNKQEAYETLK